MDPSQVGLGAVYQEQGSGAIGEGKEAGHIPAGAAAGCQVPWVVILLVLKAKVEKALSASRPHPPSTCLISTHLWWSPWLPRLTKEIHSLPPLVTMQVGLAWLCPKPYYHQHQGTWSPTIPEAALQAPLVAVQVAERDQFESQSLLCF